MPIKWNEVTWYSKLTALIFFLIVFPAWAFYLGGVYRVSRSDLDVSSEVLETKNNLNINQDSFDPKSYAGWSWEEEKPTLGEDALSISHITKESWQKISLNGRQWKTSPEEYYLRNEELAGFTESKYSRDGWVKEAKIGNQMISSVNTFAKFKNIWSYMKIVDDTLQIIIFSVSVSDSGKYYPPGYSDVSLQWCPCEELQYQIFVSDPVDIKRILD